MTSEDVLLGCGRQFSVVGPTRRTDADRQVNCIV